jgi:hypothetical protein
VASVARASVSMIARATHRPAHVLDPSQLAINAALAAGRPLLVRGEPGVGKSQLALAAARALDRIPSCAGRRSGRNALRAEAPRRVDRSRPCGFDRNRWFRSLGSWLRQRLGIVGEAPGSSVTCTITACALVYAAGRW